MTEIIAEQVNNLSLSQFTLHASIVRIMKTLVTLKRITKSLVKILLMSFRKQSRTHTRTDGSLRLDLHTSTKYARR
jgi:hypothetical protein